VPSRTFDMDNKENRKVSKALSDDDFEISDDIEEIPTSSQVLATEFDNAKGDAFDSDRREIQRGRNLPKITRLVKNLSLANADCFSSISNGIL